MLPWWVSFMLIVVGAVVVGRVASAVTPARNVGIVDGRLRPCPDAPNCVSSEAGGARGAFVVPPFASPPVGAEAADDPLERVRDALAAEPRTTIVEEADGYLRAEARSAVFGFVDDVEVRWDRGANVVHVRSASRLGYGDMGVNRNRIDRLRAALGSR